MVDKLTREKVESLLLLEDNEFNIEAFRRKHEIDPESSVLHTTFSRLVDEKKLKRIGRGLYRKLKQVKPIRSLKASEAKLFDLTFPYGYEDASSFGFEEILEIDEGNCIVVAGVSNSAKTAWVINMLALNMNKHPCILMGNEYARVDTQLSPAFVRRLRRMEWAQWEDGNGQLKFTILPVKEDYEDWVEPGKINFIDWINLSDNFYQIGKIIEDCKTAVGNGILVIVLQKAEDNLLARGGGFSRDLADFYISIDPLGNRQRRLTVVKAKATKQFMDGRMWGFEIVNGGTQFHNIREIKKCKKCYGKGHYSAGGECQECLGLGYVDK